MRKTLFLLAFLSLVSGGCRVYYALRNVIECGGAQGEAWPEGTLARFEELEADQRAASAALESSTYLALDYPDDLIWLRQELQPYVSRAEARHRQQIAQTAPACLSEMQALMVDVFYYDWKKYEAFQHGDTDRAAEIQDQSLAASDAVWREYERLVAKYGWDQ
jgi:hypothetical protein